MPLKDDMGILDQGASSGGGLGLKDDMGILPKPVSTEQDKSGGILDTIHGYAQKVQPQNIMGSLKGEIPTLAGGIIGGGASTLMKRIPLTALLGAGGEATKQIYQQATGSPEAPATSLEAAKRIGSAGAGQAIGQGLGEFGTYLGSKIIPKVAEQYRIPNLGEAAGDLRSFMEPYLPKAMQSGGKGGPGFTIAQQSEPFSSAARLETILKSSFFGSSPLKRFEYAQQKGIVDYAKSLADEIWASTEKMGPMDIGQKFAKAHEAAYRAFKNQSNVLYQELDKISGSTTVDLTPIKEEAQKILKEYAKNAGLGSSDMGNTLLGKIINLPDTVNFMEAKNIRTGLRIEGQNVEDKAIARGLASKFHDGVDKAMDKAAEQLPQGGKDLWRNTNQLYHSAMDTLDNNFISKLVLIAKDEPQNVGKTLFQNGQTDQILKIKEVLMPSPDNPLSKVVKPDLKTWQNLKAGWLEGVLEKSIDPETGIISAKQIAKVFSERGMGKETLKEIFTPEEAKIIDTFSTALTTTQKKPPSGGGGILIQLVQAGAFMGALHGGYGLIAGDAGRKKYSEGEIAGGIAVLALPRVFSRMMVSPRYHDLFLKGMSTSRPIAMPAIMKLIAGARETQKQIAQEDAQKQTSTEAQSVQGQKGW